jgi:hypothetical protein
MTRGRCSSLRLHRDGLAPSTSRRSPGAPVHSIKIGELTLENDFLKERSAKQVC